MPSSLLRFVRIVWRHDVIALLLLCVFAVVLVRTAWIGDDAGITLRSVLNFLNGYGPVFNVGERVQAFTHPLWFLLLSGVVSLTGDVIVAGFLLPILCSAVVFYVAVRYAVGDVRGALIVGSILLLSKAFIDFSTSGLENPLANLLILAIVLYGGHLLMRGGSMYRLTFLILLCALLYLTRPDLILLVAPYAGFVLLQSKLTLLRSCVALVIGSLPAIAWTAFSLFYYGFPFPNTAYAKLSSGVPTIDLAAQGLRYLGDSLLADPLTLSIIVFSVIIAIRHRVHAVLAAGCALYVAYVISIGGDFMSGRFFAAPLLVSAIITARSLLSPPEKRIAGMLMFAFGLAALPATLLSGLAYSNYYSVVNGVVDERGFYYDRQGLLTFAGDAYAIDMQWRMREPATLITCGGLGFYGLKAGPGTYLIDTCGLADPLLARLHIDPSHGWRIGHFERNIPDGYEQSVRGENVVVNEDIRRYYESLRLVTRGPLFSKERLEEVMQLNTGMVVMPVAE